MAAGTQINRTDAAAIIARQDMAEIFQAAVEQSAALSTFRRVSMGTKQARMRLIDALPTGGFVAESDADVPGVKPTSKQSWRSKELVAEELAVIVVIPENVFEDTEIGIWSEVKPRIAERLGAVLDAAVFFGQAGLSALPGSNAGTYPSTWPAAIEPGARAAGNVVSKAAITPDLAEAINQVFGKVEADGYDVNDAYTGRFLRVQLRGLRDDNHQPIYLESLRSDGMTNQILGATLKYVTNGAWKRAGGSPDAGATLIAGDAKKAILGVRQDITFKLLDQAVVGGISLAETDQIALRAKCRFGFQVDDSQTLESGGTGYPFAVLGT